MEPQTCSVEEGCLFRKIGVVPVPVADPLSKTFWVVSLSTISLIILILGTVIFILFYPFKTVTFTQPIEVTNQRPSPKEQPQVPMTGEVDMKIHFEKFIDNPAMIVRTLVRRTSDGLVVLDSNTAVSNRKRGKGVTNSHYQLLGGYSSPGKDTCIVFSIYYTLFGFRPIMVQYETEPFEITREVACK